MPTYQRAPESVSAIGDRLIASHYPTLAEAEVTIGYLMAHATTNDAGEKTGPAIKHQGYPADAVVKVVKLQDRVAGMPDVLVTIDGDQWPRWSEAQREALIDHELYHLEVLRDDEGQIKADDHGRPRLKCRLHDWQLGGFAAIARRHKEDSGEVRQAESMRANYGQLLFGFAAEEVPARGNVARDTFAALLSVGHTEDQARRAVDRALAGGKAYERVADMIDAIYTESPTASADAATLPGGAEVTNVTLDSKSFDTIKRAAKKLREKGRGGRRSAASPRA
jgi:hypothetical protein